MTTDHIKMPAVAPLVRYVANGTETEFEFPFPVFATEDLKIYLNGAPQISGFDIHNPGMTDGGSVTFDRAPADGTIVTLERRLPLERVTDFLEGGDFSAAAINNELDYLTAGLQQIDRDLSPMLRYGDHETPGVVTLPGRALRANMALGFDGNGDPVPVSLEGSMAAPDFTAVGTGAQTRSSHDKFSDAISVKDFGAMGDGLTDDTLSIQKALAAHDSVFIPPGRYFISGTIAIGERQTLHGAGQASVLVCQDDSFNAVEIRADYAAIFNLRIEGGNIGVKLYGATRPCVQVSVCDVTIWESNIGVQLDGHNDTNKPCYWNNFDRVLVLKPVIHGIHLTRSGAGDTPNANKFHACRVYSLGADIEGAGFFVEHGAFNNSFVDCEANVKGTALACFLIGAGSNKTLLINPFAESHNTVPNIKLESGSQDTAVYNLLSASDGESILDNSGGNYYSYNSGWPIKNKMARTSVSDMNATLQRYDTEYVEDTGTVTLDLSHSIHLVSSISGALTIELPRATTAPGVMMFVKKVDYSGNVITVTENGGNGPDGRSYFLGAENDFVQMISNGAEWFVISTSRAPGNTRYHNGTGTYDIDMAVDTYLLAGWSGALTARLPPANAPIAIGRTITIKKTDSTVNAITVTENGGPGPDGSSQPLTDHNDAITVVSNGASWYVISRF